MRDYFNTSIYKFFIIAFSISCALYLFFINPPKDQKENVYEKTSFNQSDFSYIYFEEVSAKMGVEYRRENETGGLVPSLSIIDINDDGYMDIFVTTSRGKSNLLYINQNGTSFKEEAKNYGLANLNIEEEPSVALWGDFFNDGGLELLLARYGCHGLYGRVKNSKMYEDQSARLNKYCSRANGVNTGDFYHHGRLDLVFANFLPTDGEKKSPDKIWLTHVRYDNETGGENHLLKNDGINFKVDKNANFLTQSYSNNAGIADVDLDGFADIFFANDNSYDQMFLNKGKGIFKEETSKYIPKKFHGFSGMNTEFFDYNQDGMIDLYVSNIFKPPFGRSFNLLWMKKKDNTFVNVSNDLSVAKCGFSWAAKFADVDNDGENDLFVVNGRFRPRWAKAYGEGKSLWFERYEVSQIPKKIRDYYRVDNLDEASYISAFERNCLFVQKNGSFFDIATVSGFDDREENRALAIIDLDNDGKIDAVTAGLRSKLKIFHNVTTAKKPHDWIGFSFRNKYGSNIPHGLRVSFFLDNGKKIIRELYPANGYHGFNDPRVHVGLGGAKIKSEIEVFWPLTKKIKKYNNVNYNQYNLLKENE